MISFQNIHKRFGQLTVLNDLSLDIKQGKTIGLVGPNGSGKTTLIKCILGLVRPDSGTVRVGDTLVNGNAEYRKNIGYMPQIGRYPENMTVTELFTLIEKMRGEQPKLKQELIERLGIGNELQKRLGNLSGGNKQKVGAVLSMMFNADLLIFDEPTAGLDPQSSINFKELVHWQKEQGKTILLTTHIMSEIEELADEIIFIVEGRLIYSGSMKELIQTQQAERLEHAVANLMKEVA